CYACDIRGMKEPASSGKTYTYRCHAGLLEVCCPIIEEEGIAGFLMFGQVLYDRNLERQRNEVWNRCREFVKDYAEFCRLFESIRKIPADYLNAAANIMTACVGYIRLEQLMKFNKSSLFEQMLHYIEKKAGTRFSLSEMSRDLSVSVSTLCKTAKARSGKTIVRLVNERRAARAKGLLADDTLTIADVAMRVGLDDYNYFSRLFKNLTGETPTAYRRRCMAENAGHI
ncbi:MAG TPA: PocR ligand-binding domain-containing protein, partial [Bacillota bacterium]|nr:PocR ligand-binding domain-containing protein [Bacillota bacterium]